MTHPELHGIVPRAVQALGEGIASDASGADYEVRLTVVEIYCERVRDLLDPLGRDNLAIKQGRDGGMFVEGAACVGGARLPSWPRAGGVMPPQQLHCGCCACTALLLQMRSAAPGRHMAATALLFSACMRLLPWRSSKGQVCGFFAAVAGATEVCVTDEAQLVGLMHAGLAARAVTATNMNAASSRSHCIVTVGVEKACPDGSVVAGKLRMVDLAGRSVRECACVLRRA